MRLANSRKALAGVVSAALMLLAALPAAATEVYRWVDKDGVTHYGDKPPTPTAKPVVLPPIQTIGPISPASASTLGQVPALPAPGLKITVSSPASDSIIRGDDRRLPMSVSLGQPLPEGAGVLFLLDGSAQNAKPSSASSYTLEGVERGSHLVSATIVDAGGRELGRAPPVIVHMKPPTVDMAPKVPKPPGPAPRPAPR